MEQCVKDYNQARWLEEELGQTQVDPYDHVAVDAYNAKVEQINQMSNDFNRNCAGKQSESARRAAEKLNQQM